MTATGEQCFAAPDISNQKPLAKYRRVCTNDHLAKWSDLGFVAVQPHPFVDLFVATSDSSK